MTAITIAGTDEAVTSGEALADLIGGLADVQEFYATHPGAAALLPHCPVLNIRVQGKTPAEKLADLRDIATLLGVPVLERDGVHSAARRFGPVLLEAHVDVLPARRIIARQDAIRKAAAA